MMQLHTLLACCSFIDPALQRTWCVNSFTEVHPHRTRHTTPSAMHAIGYASSNAWCRGIASNGVGSHFCTCSQKQKYIPPQIYIMLCILCGHRIAPPGASRAASSVETWHLQAPLHSRNKKLGKDETENWRQNAHANGIRCPELAHRGDLGDNLCLN